MGKTWEKLDRQTKRYLKLSLSVAGISLLLYFALPDPWNQYALVLSIAFAVMALGVIATR